MRVSILSALVIAAVQPALADKPPVEPDAPGVRAQAGQPVYKSIWHRDDKGNIVHLQSGLACDARVGDFARVDIRAYKSSGLDVSCNYLDAQKNFITMYLTRRAGRSLADDMAEAKRELTKAYPDVSEAPAPSQAIPGLQTATYSRSGEQIMEGIWVGDFYGWTLEYRATWSPSGESAVRGEIAALTDKAEQSAGARLNLCSRTPLPSRNGVLVTDKNDIGLTVVAQTAADMVAQLDDKTTLAEKPMTWCPEDLVGEGADTMLLWRAVFDDGSDALADKLTALSIEEPVPIVSTPDAPTNLILDETAKGNRSKKRWTVTLTNDTQTWLFAFYDGRPGKEELARIGNDIHAHKARPLGNYDWKTKKITISTPDGR